MEPIIPDQQALRLVVRQDLSHKEKYRLAQADTLMRLVALIVAVMVVDDLRRHAGEPQPDQGRRPGCVQPEVWACSSPASMGESRSRPRVQGGGSLAGNDSASASSIAASPLSRSFVSLVDTPSGRAP